MKNTTKTLITALIVGGVLLAAGVLLGFSLGEKNKPSPQPGGPAPEQRTPDSSGKTEPTGKVLDMSNKGLTKVGPEIYDQKGVNTLILSHNQLKSLVSEMGRMTSLKVLKVDHNIIEGSLIGEIRQMSQLTTLDASYNNMTGVPAEIGQLNQLQTLNYSYNNIDSFPNEIKNLKNNLKELDLTGNPLSAEKLAELKAALPNTNIRF
jgi:Leucine-rich repeat (LRR) protein